MTVELSLLQRVSFRDREITAPRLRGLLALLAEDLRTGCSTGRLVEGLWPDEQPERPGRAVQVLVSRARAQLGAEVIASTATGYRLALAETQVDSSALLLHAAASADRARAGDHAGSLAEAEAGLALWEGDGTDGQLADPVSDLRALRLPARESLARARALALARLGRHAEAVEPLTEAARAHRRDEEVLAELLRCEAAVLGPSAALARYEAYRRELRDGLGTDPGPGLQVVQQELLRGAAPVVRRGIRHEPNPLLGRDDDIAAVTRLLHTSRVVSVTGPGGLGKTRLAHAVGRQWGASGSGAPGLGVPGSGARGAGASGSGAPGSGVSGSGAPGSGVSASAALASAALGSAAPGSGAPGLGVSGSAALGSGVPGSGVPGSGASGSAAPGSGAAGSPRAEQSAVHVVPLAGVTADADVAGEVASALGAGDGHAGAGGHPGSADPVPGILRALGPGATLLVLDNCEQVVGGAADLVQSLVSASKDVRVLTTGRSPLGLTSEAVYALPELDQDVSAELFRQRAQAARPGVELPAEAVAELCRHLDGLPLAVELAAARVRVLSVPEIARRLGDRFALLRGGARDVPERHRTLHAVVEWSWNLLEPPARRALRTLSLFPGGFTGEAADRVLGGDALLLLEQLTDQSLLKAADTADGGVRFHMLETVREFSAARRAEAGEDEAATDRFLTWARDFGRDHHDVLFGPDQVAAWDRIRGEQDNLVLALRLALARGDDSTTAAVAAVLSCLWSTGSNYARLAALAADTGRPLSHFRPGPEDVETVRTVSAVSTATAFMGYGPHAVRQLATLRRLPPGPPDTLPRALSVVLCALPEMRPPEYTALRRLCDGSDPSAPAGAPGRRHPMLAFVAQCVASYVWEYENDVERALDTARGMIAALGDIRNPTAEFIGHSRLSDLCLRTEQSRTAYDHLKAALAACESTGAWTDSDGLRWGLVLACLQRGAVDEAEQWLRQTEREQPPEPAGTSDTGLPARAEIALARGLTEVGLRLWRRAVDQAHAAGAQFAEDPFMNPWELEVRSAAVAAHAQAGRPEPVAHLTLDLRERLRGLLDLPVAAPGQLPVYGTVLLALGLAGLAEGDTSAVRLLALAERLSPVRQYPTFSVARCRQAAEDADGAAYADAVSEYAALGRDELLEAVRTAVTAATAPSVHR
ncbi:BTAD domain-containing putative transcriptional regulator [Streptomyces sp. DH24]|uniref:AfsR/SARP family transcriptional regulator n=1 Tax=Streptomyces sp. DH24 TaxID=3040123 RepID=UPI002441DFBA|nr:BTAD domain-containing putative transcriptional regulator [Streptomyces sp. DH24]MDG9717354.1 BTAD domain-containing putative transcriptional regulator [Streptomyces sp. DH24]